MTVYIGGNALSKTFVSCGD